MESKWEIWKDFLKHFVPVAIAITLFCLFNFTGRNPPTQDDLFLSSLVIAFPFGAKRSCFFFSSGGDTGTSAGLFILGLAIGAIIGLFVLAWRIVVVLYYIPLTIYRLVKFRSKNIAI